MTNPFKPHVLPVFSDRDSIDEALAYAMDVINGLSDNKAYALTALMVVVNTAAKLWPEAPAQVADLSDLGALRSRIAAIEERLGGEDFFLSEAALDRRIEDRIESWAEDNFNERADDWLSKHADLDNEIENWIENNLDVEDAVQDVLRNASLRINF